jgi:hypothetical protein
MRTLALGALFAIAACATPTTEADDFSNLGDSKSDSFSYRMKIVGDLSYGQTSDTVAYTKHPRYRAFTFSGSEGDAVAVTVASTDGSPMFWVLDAKFHILFSGTDDGTGVAHNSGTLSPSTDPTHYIVFREASLQKASFSVELEGKPSFYDCQTDDDCVAISKGGCCANGWKVAVNVNEVMAYEAANACTVKNPICPLYVVNDTRVAQCNTTTNQCEMVAPKCVDNVLCKLGTHWSPTACKCVADCVDNIFCIAGTHWDSTACTCVPNT